MGPAQRRVARLAKELGLEFYKVYKEGKTRMYYEVRNVHIGTMNGFNESFFL